MKQVQRPESLESWGMFLPNRAFSLKGTGQWGRGYSSGLEATSERLDCTL